MLLRAASSPESARQVLTSLVALDVRPLLPRVGVPTLVVHRSADAVVPVEAGRSIARLLPDAEWVELPGADHIFFVDGGMLAARIAAFVQGVAQPDLAQGWIGAILHAVAGDGATTTTALQARIRAYQPRHVRYEATAVTALFESSCRALECARGLRTADGGCTVVLDVGECRAAGQPPRRVVDALRRAAAAAPGRLLATPAFRAVSSLAEACAAPVDEIGDDTAPLPPAG